MDGIRWMNALDNVMDANLAISTLLTVIEKEITIDPVCACSRGAKIQSPPNP